MVLIWSMGARSSGDPGIRRHIVFKGRVSGLFPMGNSAMTGQNIVRGFKVVMAYFEFRKSVFVSDKKYDHCSDRGYSVDEEVGFDGECHSITNM
jgi:hypothetical protein